jgi:toxin CcdB
LLDVQSDLLEGVNLRALVPLFPQGNAPIAAVPASILKAPVGELSDRFEAISAALKLCCTGFDHGTGSFGLSEMRR